jgi:hypothetical protein
LALIVGGGSATAVQLGSVAIRGTSTATTGGIANPIVAILEAIGSFCMSLLALVAPLIAALLALAILVFVIRRLRSIYGWWRTRRATTTALESSAEKENDL